MFERFKTCLSIYSEARYWFHRWSRWQQNPDHCEEVRWCRQCFKVEWRESHSYDGGNYYDKDGNPVSRPYTPIMRYTCTRCGEFYDWYQCER